MSNLRLMMWMGFVFALGAFGLIAFGNHEAQIAGENILGCLAFLTVFFGVGAWLA